MVGTDFQGIASIILAVGVAFPSVVAAIGVLVSLKRGAKRDEKMDQAIGILAVNTTTLAVVEKHVNGMTKVIADKSHALGVIEGANEERANPTEPK